MSGPELRPYQANAVDRILHEIAHRRRAMLTMDCGLGKTIVAAKVTADVVDRGGRVVIVAHRRELCAQASRKLFEAGITDHGLIQADVRMRLDQPVQICSIQTLHSRIALRRVIEPPPADLLVIDEAHRSRAYSYETLINAYPKTPILGMSATPTRRDNRGLGDVFDVLIVPITTADAIAGGWLVPTVTYAPSTPNLAGVRVERGDYVIEELSRRMDTPQLVGDVVEHWLRLAQRRSTIIFATSIAHSIHLRNELRAADVRCEHLDGQTATPERDAILAALGRGEIEVLTNCAVLCEGFDSPNIGCIVLARPTKSLGLYRQMAGRGLRPAPGKSDCILLDHSGAVFQHGLVEEPIEWTLDVGGRARNAAQQARAEMRAPQIVTCPECHAIRQAGEACRHCGWRPAPKCPVSVDVLDGELARVDVCGRLVPPVYDEGERHRFHRMLVFIGQERNYAPGWAAYKFREKFGSWPARRFAEPLEPTPEVRAWVRSRMIAYAKSMERQRMGAVQ